MSLAAFSDANNWLDAVKLAFLNEEDAEEEAASADAIVKGALADVFPDNVNLWIRVLPDPNTTPPILEVTPDLVREIASMLMAAQLYQKRYSEETPRTFNYGTSLQQRAMALLKMLRDGQISLADVDIVNSLGFLLDDYWPNDGTVVTLDMPDLIGPDLGEPLRFFRMEDVY